MVMQYATLAVGMLKIAAEAVDVGKDIWKKVKPPETLAKGKEIEGVLDRDYYSDTYKFKMSVPDDTWQFWKPTADFKNSFLGGAMALPTKDMPVVVLSRQLMNMMRPYVQVIVEDIGSFTSVSEVLAFEKQVSRLLDWQVKDEDVHVYEGATSGILVKSQPFLEKRLFQVEKVHLYRGRAYYLLASYVPASEELTALPGGLQEIMNSFQLIKQ
jgi:hypothetical protein